MRIFLIINYYYLANATTSELVLAKLQQEMFLTKTSKLNSFKTIYLKRWVFFETHPHLDIVEISGVNPIHISRTNDFSMDILMAP